MLNFIDNGLRLFGLGRKNGIATAVNEPMGRPRRPEMRRFEAADTSRLNSLHWASASDSSINSLLATYLGVVRGRAQWEAHQNPDVEGIIQTHCDDVVGPDGPTLQAVARTGKRYRDNLEKLWWNWWEAPDANGVLSGPDWLSLCVRMLWICGEHLTQITGSDEPTAGLSLRIRAIHPRRLYTPAAYYGDLNVILGVRRTPAGRPLSYFISNDNVNQTVSLVNDYTELSVGQCIHDFHCCEPDQARGVPWLTSSLQTIADLRDYCNQVMDAARAAADMGVLLYTRSPDVQTMVVNETTEIERRTISSLPPGYEAMQITPQQPSTQYADFVADRLRAVGRPVGMPLMMIRLDSGDHNYSSARFDSQVYQRAVKKLQGRLGRRLLNRLVLALAQEAELLGLLGNRPEDLELNWIWPTFPHVDPSKETDAAIARLSAGLSTGTAEAAAIGQDFEAVIAKQAEEKAMCEAAGIEPPEWLARKKDAGTRGPGDAGTADTADDAEETADDADDAEEQDDEQDEETA